VLCHHVDDDRLMACGALLYLDRTDAQMLVLRLSLIEPTAHLAFDEPCGAHKPMCIEAAEVKVTGAEAA
jgi:hypothetical protein